jgi:hypothetical protein
MNLLDNKLIEFFPKNRHKITAEIKIRMPVNHGELNKYCRQIFRIYCFGTDIKSGPDPAFILMSQST